jgi:hypothetical protein
MKSVYSAVRTGSLNKAVWASSVKGHTHLCLVVGENFCICRLSKKFGFSKHNYNFTKRTAIFLAITQRVVVIPYQRFGTDKLSQYVGKELPLLAV